MKKLSTIVTMVVTSVFLLPAYGQWAKYTIDENISQPTGLISGDIDSDGDRDIAAAIFGDADLVWYENDNTTWTKHTIADNIGGVGVIIADIDGDENPDVTVAVNATSMVKWYRNEGGSPITWTPFTIDNNLNRAEFVSVGDIDNDGDADVAATGYIADHLVWYENNGGEPISWTKDTIDASLDGAGFCDLVDLDGDDTLDVVAIGMDASKVNWYKNKNAGQEWTKYIIDEQLASPAEANIADIDGDGDPDMVVTGTNANDVVWYENTGGTPIGWTKHTIDDNLGGAFEVAVADIDMNGTPDVFASANGSGDVVWYANEGGSPASWNKFTIEEALTQVWCVISYDVDGDNFPDVIVNQWLTDASIIWYENPFIGVGIEQTLNTGSFSIYPVPANDWLTVETELSAPYTIAITSMNGQLLYNGEVKRNLHRIDLSAFRDGIYFITIRSEDSVTTSKIIKL